MRRCLGCMMKIWRWQISTGYKLIIEMICKRSDVDPTTKQGAILNRKKKLKIRAMQQYKQSERNIPMSMKDLFSCQVIVFGKDAENAAEVTGEYIGEDF